MTPLTLQRHSPAVARRWSTGLRLTIALGALAFAPSCTDSSSGGGGGGATPGQTISEQLAGLGLTTLGTALDAAGLTTVLDGPGPFTLFAPTDAAFAALDPALLAFLLDPANVAVLTDVLQYHIADGDFDAAALSAQPGWTMQNGGSIVVDPLGPILLVNDSRVVDGDIDATNGKIHIVDVVLRPPVSLVETLSARGFNTLAAAITAAGLEGALTGANVTLFAPTDDAFANLAPGVLANLLDPANVAQLQQLLLYHVRADVRRSSDLFFDAESPSLEGALQFYGLRSFIPTVNRAAVSTPNLPATDGLIHGIDAVLSVPANLLTTLVNRGFTTLVQLIEAAELEDDLATGGPFTVIAPTNSAFAALPPGVLDDLLNPMNQPQLIALLQYHLLPEVRQAREIRAREALTTVQGTAIAVDPLGGFLTLNGSTDVIRPDLLSSNGIIHSILDVLMLPQP